MSVKKDSRITRRDFLKMSGAVVGAAALAGCAQPTATPVPPTAVPAAAPAAAAPAAAATGPVFGAPAVLKGATINYLSSPWYVPELDDAYRIFAIEWATQNKVKFNWEQSSDASYTAKWQASIEAKAGSTLIETDLAPNAFLGGSTDLTDVAEAIQADAGEYYPLAKYYCNAAGKWRGIPWGSHPRVMAYRTDWFKEQGYTAFPKMWDGPGSVYEAGVKLKKAGHPYGFTMSPNSLGDGVSHIWSILWSYGAKEFNKDGSLAIDSPEMVEGLQFIKRLYDDCCEPGVTAYTEAGNNQAFIAGQVSATLNVNTIYLPARTSNPTLAAAMNHSPHPAGPKGQFAWTSVPFVFLASWVKGNDAAAAKQFLYDAFSLSGYAKFIKHGQGYLVPVAPGWDDLPIWPSDPKLAYAKAQSKLGRLSGYDLPEASGLSGQCYAQGTWIKMVNVMLESGDAKKAIAWGTQNVNDIKKQMGL